MADPALQALLDPAANGEGITILRRLDDAAGTTSSYYVEGNVLGIGRAMWVNVTTANTDAQKNTSIRTAIGVS